MFNKKPMAPIGGFYDYFENKIVDQWRLLGMFGLLFFSVPPTIKVPNQLLGAPVQTDVQLECYVEAFPNTINYWVKNRSDMLLNG